MNLRELVELTIDKALEYIVEADHEIFLEELVDTAVNEGMDREELFGINSELDEYLKVQEDEEEDGDY
jgi:hypothetical protein